MKRIIAASLLGLLLSGPSRGDDSPPTYDRINLSASASREIQNDELQAVLYAQREEPGADQAADQINQVMHKVQAEMEKYPSVSHQSQGYSTTPIYSKSSFASGRRVVAWRVRQSIHIKSRDFTAMSRLIGRLQQTLALQGISYSISEERRRQAEEKLIGKAIEHFKQRARLITEAWGKQAYRLVELNINTSNAAPRPYLARAMSMESKDVTPPRLEAGTQRIEVRVTGRIELK